MKKPILKQMLRPALALVAALLLAGPSVAADVTLNLTAEARTVTMPDGAPRPHVGVFRSCEPVRIGRPGRSRWGCRKVIRSPST